MAKLTVLVKSDKKILVTIEKSIKDLKKDYGVDIFIPKTVKSGTFVIVTIEGKIEQNVAYAREKILLILDSKPKTPKPNESSDTVLTSISFSEHETLNLDPGITVGKVPKFKSKDFQKLHVKCNTTISNPTTVQTNIREILITKVDAARATERTEDEGEDRKLTLHENKEGHSFHKAVKGHGALAEIMQASTTEKQFSNSTNDDNIVNADNLVNERERDIIVGENRDINIQNIDESDNNLNNTSNINEVSNVVGTKHKGSQSNQPVGKIHHSKTGSGTSRKPGETSSPTPKAQGKGKTVKNNIKDVKAGFNAVDAGKTGTEKKKINEDLAMKEKRRRVLENVNDKEKSQSIEHDDTKINDDLALKEKKHRALENVNDKRKPQSKENEPGASNESMLKMKVEHHKLAEDIKTDSGVKIEEYPPRAISDYVSTHKTGANNGNTSKTKTDQNKKGINPGKQSQKDKIKSTPQRFGLQGNTTRSSSTGKAATNVKAETGALRVTGVELGKPPKKAKTK